MSGPSSKGLDALLHRTPPSWFEQFKHSPYSTIAKTLYSFRSKGNPLPDDPPLTIVCVSDTHNAQPDIPPGDLLIHAGDTTQGGTIEELSTALRWLNAQPHEHKILIAGNHELILDPMKNGGKEISDLSINFGSVKYLKDESTVLKFRGGRSFNVYGNPWTRGQGNWGFQYPTGSRNFDGVIPEDADIVVTHMPPKFHLDINGFGDESLLCEISRVEPKLHVFGHIHGGRGTEVVGLNRPFEKLYQKAFVGRLGVLSSIALLLWSLVSRFWPHAYEKYGLTLLVNAACVGGYRDEILMEPTVLKI